MLLAVGLRQKPSSTIGVGNLRKPKWVPNLALGDALGLAGELGAYRGFAVTGLYASTIVQGCGLWVKLKEKRLR